MSDESQSENRLDALAEEFVARFRNGEHPSLTEYVAKHPQLEEEIRDLFPALILIEQARPKGTERIAATSSDILFEKLPEKLDDYRIVREIGRGGMGIVYEAIQESLGRHVALKVLPRQMTATDARAQRFQREARAAARLSHPNIVPVYNVGEFDGVHFYAMQFIRGLGLDQVAREIKRLAPHPSPKSEHRADPPADPPLSIPTQRVLSGVIPSREVIYENAASIQSPPNAEQLQAQSDSRASVKSLTLREGGRNYWYSIAQIGEQVALALQYAADQGVLHRDIKPANLLLDMQGKVWITDFGLATELSGDGLTQSGDIIGTLRYMAPERLRGISSPLVDVYSLGATLYELVTLQPIFGQLSHEQILHAVSTATPKRPRAIDPNIPQDLETILLKAIAKEPSERYQSSKDLADDLRCFFENKPIHAKKARPIDQLWKWCRRNPAVASLVSLSALLIVLATAGLWISSIVRFERDEAVRQRELATAAKKASDSLLARAQKAENEATAREHLARALAIQRTGREGQRIASLNEIRLATDRTPSESLKRELTECVISALSRADLETKVEFPLNFNGPCCFNHQATQFVQIETNRAGANRSDNKSTLPRDITGDYSLHVRNSNDWGKVTRIPGPSFPCFDAMPQYSLDDQYLIVFFITAEGDDRLVVYETSRFDQVHSCQLQTPSIKAIVGLHPNGSTIAYQEPNLDLVLWDLKGAKELHRLPFEKALQDICFDATGDQLALLRDDGSILSIVSTLDFKEIVQLRTTESEPTAKSSVAWSSDNQLLAACRVDGLIEIWNVPEKTLTTYLQGHQSVITAASFLRDQYVLRTKSWDGTNRVWDAALGIQLFSSERELLGFASNDQLAFSTGVGLTAGLCDFLYQDHVQHFRSLTNGNTIPAPRSNGIRWATFSPDESLLVVHGSSSIDFWDVGTRRRLSSITVDNCIRILFAPDGSFMLSVLPQHLHFWPINIDMDKAQRKIQIGPPTEILVRSNPKEPAILSDIRWIEPGEQLVAFDASVPELVVFKRSAGNASFERVTQYPSIHDEVPMLAVSPNKMWLAAGSHHHDEIQIWNLETKERIAILPDLRNPRPSYSLNFTPDSRWLVVSVSKDVVAGGHLIYETGTWRKHGFRQTELSPGLPVLFSRNNYLATMTAPHEVQITEVENGEVITRLMTPNARLNIPVAVIHDDSKLAMISGTRTEDIVVWDLASIKQSLKNIGLDWKIPVGSPSSDRETIPVNLTIDDGGISQRTRAEKITKKLNQSITLARSRRYSEAMAILEPIEELSQAPPDRLNELAWSLAVRPECSAIEATFACVLSELSLKRSPMNASYWNTLGVCRFRNRQYQSAIVALEKSEMVDPEAYPTGNAYFLAMSYWHLANFDAAQKWLAIASQTYDQLQAPSEEIQQFRIESESLLKKE